MESGTRARWRGGAFRLDEHRVWGMGHRVSGLGQDGGEVHVDGCVGSIGFALTSLGMHG